MTLSVVLISWNSLRHLRRCLLSLRELMEDGTVEFIWVDNGSDDGAYEFMSSRYPFVRRIPLARNMGVAYARNRGIECARGRYILLLDDDTEASPEALRLMVRYMELNPGCGLCALSLRDEKGHLQASFKPFPSLGIKVRNMVSRNPQSDFAELPGGIVHPDYVIGACQMFRRSLVRSLGLLDEAIFYGPEDADWCMRIAATDATIDYIPEGTEVDGVPAPAIVHRWKRASRRRPWSRLSRLHFRALVHFWFKHRRF